MRYTPEHKQQTRERILEAAGRVFREQGYGGGGIAAVMKEAGLTHGGFYAHFEDKEELLAEAITRVVGESSRVRVAGCEHLTGLAWVVAVCDRYLSEQHMRAVGEGCPAPCLLSELARSGGRPQESFRRAVLAWRDEIASRLGPGEVDLAFGIIASCVGGLGMARSVSDPEVSRAILDSTRRLIRASLGGPGSDETDEGEE